MLLQIVYQKKIILIYWPSRKIPTSALGMQNMDLPIKRVEYLKDKKWVWTRIKGTDKGKIVFHVKQRKDPFTFLK